MFGSWWIRWIMSMYYKDIGTLYILFGAFSALGGIVVPAIYGLDEVQWLFDSFWLLINNQLVVFFILIFGFFLFDLKRGQFCSSGFVNLGNLGHGVTLLKVLRESTLLHYYHHDIGTQ